MFGSSQRTKSERERVNNCGSTYRTLYRIARITRGASERVSLIEGGCSTAMHASTQARATGCVRSTPGFRSFEYCKRLNPPKQAVSAPSLPHQATAPSGPTSSSSSHSSSSSSSPSPSSYPSPPSSPLPSSSSLSSPLPSLSPPLGS